MSDDPRLEVIDEESSGRNRMFRDSETDEILTLQQVTQRIRAGRYPDYHIMHRDGKEIPRSNPDGNKVDNLE